MTNTYYHYYLNKVAKSDKHSTEVRVGDYQTSYFFVCPSAKKLYENIEQIAASCNALVIYTAGKYKVKIQKPSETSVMAFNTIRAQMLASIFFSRKGLF